MKCGLLPGASRLGGASPEDSSVHAVPSHSWPPSSPPLPSPPAGPLPGAPRPAFPERVGGAASPLCLATGAAMLHCPAHPAVPQACTVVSLTQCRLASSGWGGQRRVADVARKSWRGRSLGRGLQGFIGAQEVAPGVLPAWLEASRVQSWHPRAPRAVHPLRASHAAAPGPLTFFADP